MKQQVNKRCIYCPIAIIVFILIITCSCKKESTSQTINAIDLDGNVYHTLTIGTQVWMLENLKTTKYRNGDPIPLITNDSVWSKLTTGACCNYNNDTSYVKTYGRLYNWYAVNDDRNIAPVGWHVPTDAEWKILTDYLAGDTLAGGKLKESGTSHWGFPNVNATNESGFTALPGGDRYFSGHFGDVGYHAFWWCSTEFDSSRSWCRMMVYSVGSVSRLYIKKLGGSSVRCIKD